MPYTKKFLQQLLLLLLLKDLLSALSNKLPRALYKLKYKNNDMNKYNKGKKK